MTNETKPLTHGRTYRSNTQNFRRVHALDVIHDKSTGRLYLVRGHVSWANALTCLPLEHGGSGHARAHRVTATTNPRDTFLVIGTAQRIRLPRIRTEVLVLPNGWMCIGCTFLGPRQARTLLKDLANALGYDVSKRRKQP